MCWTNTDGNASNGWGCWIDTTKYKDGAYTVKAVAYNAAGQTATVTHPVTIQNARRQHQHPPTVGITRRLRAPRSPARPSYTATADDTDGSVAKVDALPDERHHAEAGRHQDHRALLRHLQTPPACRTAARR